MKEFIDKTSESSGTPISRKNLMAIQGFVSSSFTFNDDGSITETNSDGETLTTSFGNDGVIYETFVGEKELTKKTTFSENKIIVEVI